MLKSTNDKRRPKSAAGFGGGNKSNKIVSNFTNGARLSTDTSSVDKFN